MAQLYREYLRTDAWKFKADQAKAAAGFRCQIVTNGTRCMKRATQAHHLSYRRLFHERPGDLMAVCAECHRRLHHILGLVANDNQLTLPLAEPRR